MELKPEEKSQNELEFLEALENVAFESMPKRKQTFESCVSTRGWIRQRHENVQQPARAWAPRLPETEG